MYWEVLYHLDLCILAYQIYNQTLVWPLDPWYERFSDRLVGSQRSRFLRHLHEALDRQTEYHGPGRTQGFSSNDSLDPILHRYDNINPAQISFNYDGTIYNMIRAPSAITSRIGEVYVSEYTTDPNGGINAGSPNLRQLRNGAGPDTLYCFEGGTGAVPGESAAWSVMGFVLKRRHTNGNGYDIHIAFRGSRSGAAGRAAVQGLFGSKGNPDWVTDMDFRSVGRDQWISEARGSASRGFGNAVRRCVTAINRCLMAIDIGEVGPPQSIWVTGHSLGGALAVQLGSALVNGAYRNFVASSTHEWPWQHLRLVTFGAPVVGGGEFAQEITNNIGNLRVKIGGDPITQGAVRNHAGHSLQLDAGYWFNTDAHEPRIIREQVMKLGGSMQPPPQLPSGGFYDIPWASCETFEDLYARFIHNDASLRAILGPRFSQDAAFFLSRLARDLSGSSANVLSQHLGLVQGLIDMPPRRTLTVLADLAKGLKDIHNRTKDYVILLYILLVWSEHRQGLRFHDIQGDPTLRGYLKI
ncbi:MAG: hypothetical protein U1A78_39690 [Polyangia bacterium]